MGLFSRLATFFGIQMHAALDHAEDPGQVMDYSYGKQLEQLHLLRRALADVVTNKKRLELQQAQLIERANKLDQQAKLAFEAQREDLSRIALQRKETLLVQLKGYEQQIAQLQAQAEKLMTIERAVTQRIEAFRTQKEMVKAQYHAAQAQVNIQEALTGISQEMSEMNAAMQRAQDTVLTMQARANALETLTEQGILEEQGLLGAGTNDSLDYQLQQLTTEQRVEAQLQVMKQQLRLGGPESSSPYKKS